MPQTETATFDGFRPEAIQFLVDLAENNSRDWFQPRKADYERLLKEPMERLCLALESQFRSRGIPLHADPARSPFRIYRDTRFSKDKSPYKTALAASFGWAGDGADAAAGRSHAENVHASGGYFHLQPGEIYVGGGVWHPEPSWLLAFRQRIVTDYDGFRAIVEAPAFVDDVRARRATTASRSSGSRRASPPTTRPRTSCARRTSPSGAGCRTTRRMGPDLPRRHRRRVRGWDAADALPGGPLGAVREAVAARGARHPRR